MTNLAVLRRSVDKVVPCGLCFRFAGQHAIQAQAMNFRHDGKVAFARLAFVGTVLHTPQPVYLEILQSAQDFRHTGVIIDLVSGGNADSTEYGVSRSNSTSCSNGFLVSFLLKKDCLFRIEVTAVHW